ncbi:MAG: DNA recombination protein RmuC [Gemmatimonadota bacterium]|nr:DNA recombination protein RmuC [Gemmatimonadota bacterium]
MITDNVLPALFLGVGLVVGAYGMWLVHKRILPVEIARANATALAEARLGESVLRESLARHEAEAMLTARTGNVAELLHPIRETLARYDDVLATLGKSQAQTAGAIVEQLHAVSLGGEALRRETQKLSQALRAPNVRGQWGELQLKRVCELAGMLEYCDFEPQVTVRGDDGAQRPDLIVRVPGGRQLVVDAKAPLSAYLEAMAASDEQTRAEKLAAHAAHLRVHVAKLSAKRYWAQFAESPEFVVLFLPGEAFFSAALEADPSLLEVALTERVVLATPTTLIALLKAAAYGWRQERVAHDAERLMSLGRELHERIATFDEQLVEVGRGLTRAVTAYNRALGSLETRVLVAARRLSDLGATSDVLESPPPIEITVRGVPQG